MPNRMHTRPATSVPAGRGGSRRWPRRFPASTCRCHTAPCALFTPERGARLSARGNPAASTCCATRSPTSPATPSLARSWAKCARDWPRGAQTQLLDAYPRLQMPVLLLWADQDRLHPLRRPKRRCALLPRRQLRVLPSTGFLIAYDDPVGLARELVAFCG